MGVTTKFSGQPHRELAVQRSAVRWTSDAAGNASGVVPLCGMIQRVIFVPDSGSTQPDDGYAAQLTDAAGLNLFAAWFGDVAALADEISNSAPVHGVPKVANADASAHFVPFVGEDTTLIISGAGASNSGVVVIYTR